MSEQILALKLKESTANLFWAFARSMFLIFAKRTLYLDGFTLCFTNLGLLQRPVITFQHGWLGPWASFAAHQLKLSPIGIAVLQWKAAHWCCAFATLLRSHTLDKTCGPVAFDPPTMLPMSPRLDVNIR